MNAKKLVNMKKNIVQTILFSAVIAMTAILASSCSNDNGGSSGTPYISYVRVANPASADSLLVAAGQGQLVAIVGNNLQNTQQVWFNDLQSVLTPTYISKTCVFASVPSTIPADITDQLKLVFANGDSLLYPFKVTISKPLIDGANPASPVGMDCEYVADGDIATIHGQYFYLPITVTFPGASGDLTVSSDDGDVTVNTANTILSVKVPEGSQPGQITVTSNFGTSKSNFMFRDNRDIIQGFDGDPTGGTTNDPFWDLGSNGGVIVADPNAGVTSPTVTVTNPGPNDPPILNGNYIRMIFSGQTWWTQLFCNWTSGNTLIPSDAIVNPSGYYLKFEVCTTKPFNGSGLDIWITDMTSQNHTYFPLGQTSSTIQYAWTPSFDSKGAWATMTIPLEDIAAAQTSGGFSYYPGILPGGYFFGFVYAGSLALDCDMSFDNFRIVPKTISGN